MPTVNLFLYVVDFGTGEDHEVVQIIAATPEQAIELLRASLQTSARPQHGKARLVPLSMFPQEAAPATVALRYWNITGTNIFYKGYPVTLSEWPLIPGVIGETSVP